MVEPVTLIVTAFNLYQLFSFGKQIFNKIFGSEPTTTTPFSILFSTHPLPLAIEDSSVFDRIDSKKTDRSSSESTFPIGVILIILIIIGIMIFIFYRKQNKLKENQRKYRYSDDSPFNRSPTDDNHRLSIV